MPSSRFILILGLLTLVGALLRFYQLGVVPVGLYWDEVAILVDAKALAATGQDMHGNPWFQAIFPSYGDYKLPVYIWLASVSVKLFGATNWALRLPSALAGLGTILVAGLLSWQLLSHEFKSTKKAKQQLFLWTSLVVALAPWSILFSRTGFEGYLGQLWLAVSIWAALKLKKHWGWGVLAALLGSLATYTYFSIRFVWPVVFMAAVLLFNAPQRRQVLSWLTLSLVLPLLLYALSLWPMFNSPLYSASNQFRLSTTSVLNMADWPVVANQYKLLAGNTPIDKVIYHPRLLQARELIANYADNLSADFMFFTGDANLRHGTGRHGLFLTIFIIPFVYGWFTIFVNHWRTGALLLVWWLVALLPASVPEVTPHALRSLNALVPLSIAIGWGCWAGWLTLKNNTWPSLIKTATQAGLWLALALAVFDFTSFYFTAYPIASASYWQADYQKIASEVWRERGERTTVWSEPTDGRFYLWLMAYEIPVEDFPKIKLVNYLPPTNQQLEFEESP